jgi:hypothetical protein
MNPDKETTLEITIRTPHWSQNYDIDAQGAEIKKEANYCYVSKSWKKGDKITLTLKPTLVAHKANNGEYYLQRGDIVYCLNIPGDAQTIKDWKLNGLVDQYFTAKKGFEYEYQFVGTVENAFGFTFSTKPTGKNLWVESPTLLKGKMLNPKTSKVTEVTFVPIGSTILRQVTFPAK